MLDASMPFSPQFDMWRANYQPIGLTILDLTNPIGVITGITRDSNEDTLESQGSLSQDVPNTFENKLVKTTNQEYWQPFSNPNFGRCWLKAGVTSSFNLPDERQDLVQQEGNEHLHQWHPRARQTYGCVWKEGTPNNRQIIANMINNQWME